VGDFLGDSIRDFWARYPLDVQFHLWREAGLRDVEVRWLSVGGGVVMWGTKE
jgi:demethylmenaquinone methyltransferase/2-methoxy-6-polyprenyl-1,4-benzoquinol methylase